MIRDFTRGFTCAWSGLKALTTPGLGRFVILPALISATVFVLIIAAGMAGFSDLMARLLAWLPAWLDWLQWLLWPLFALAGILIALYSFTLLANLVGAPFNGLLAARYEQMLSGASPPGDERPMLTSLLASFKNEMRKLFYLLRWLLLAAVLFVLPGINLVAPAVWIVLGAWLLALEYVAYPMDNHVLEAKRQRQILGNRRSLSLGFGFGVMLMSSVPLLNLLLMPAAVLGATRLWQADLAASLRS